MSFRKRSFAEDDEGFTLIELLVVILIIGVLAAIAIPAFSKQRTAAIDASLKSDMKSMALSIETWQVAKRSSISDAPVPTDSSGWTIVTYSSPDDILLEPTINPVSIYLMV